MRVAFVAAHLLDQPQVPHGGQVTVDLGLRLPSCLDSSLMRMGTTELALVSRYDELEHHSAVITRQ